VGGYLVVSMHLDSILHEIIVAELCMWPCYVCIDLVPHPYYSISYLIILHGGSHVRVVLLLAMSTWGWRLFKTLGLDSGLWSIKFAIHPA